MNTYDTVMMMLALLSLIITLISLIVKLLLIIIDKSIKNNCLHAWKND